MRWRGAARAMGGVAGAIGEIAVVRDVGVSGIESTVSIGDTETWRPTMSDEIENTETEVRKLLQKLAELRKRAPPVPVKNYVFRDLRGDVTPIWTVVLT